MAMETTLNELLDTNNVHPLAVEFRKYHEEAKEYRKIMVEGNIPQTIGKFTTSLPDPESGLIEYMGFSIATSAIHVMLEYITHKKPLDLPDYLALQEMVIKEYPHSIWDDGMWFKRIGKEVGDYNLPCTPKMKEVLNYNRLLRHKYDQAQLYAMVNGVEITDVLSQMRMGPIKEVIIESNKVYEQEVPRENLEDDMLQLYLVLTGKVKKEQME